VRRRFVCNTGRTRSRKGDGDLVILSEGVREEEEEEELWGD